MKSITIEAREVYGNIACYPACEMSRLFANIAGTKTLTMDRLRMIEAAGFEIEITRPRVAFIPSRAR